MKNLIQNISVSIVLILAFSCSDDFIKDEPNVFREINPIVISPDWQAQDYAILCDGVGNAKFTVVHAPAWLKISNRSGQFTNNVAMLNCKANTHKDFSEVGIYHSMITLSVEGKKNRAVPVMYINEGNPKIEIASRVTVSYDNPNSASLLVKNTGEGILLWTVIQRPKWLLIYDDMYGTSDIIEDYSVFVLPANGTKYVKLSFNPSATYSENLSGKIVIQTNDKNKPAVEVDVQMNMGNPSLDTSWQSGIIDFGRTETIRNFSFANQGNGILSWKIEGCPGWLTVSETKGTLHSHHSTTLTFTCNRELLKSGVNEVTIYLRTNDKTKPSYPIIVIARGNTENNDNVKAIEGNIADAWFDKKTDILYLVTAQPNCFLAYDTHSKSILHKIDLTKAPTCLTVSEDGKKAAIGHSGAISAINMENFTLTKTLEISHSVYDIAWTDGDWYCYSQKGGNFTNIHSINTTTETKQDYSEQYSEADGATNIGKVPGQQYIIAARRETSPTGIIVYDINTKSLKNYHHESIGDFWFSFDGKYLFESYGNVYKTTDLNMKNIAPVDKLKITEYYYWDSISWIDYSNSGLWVVCNSIIYQLDINDYFIMKTYYYDDFYNGRDVQAKYLFANNAGTELVAIRNATTGNAMWSLEFIPIKK